MSSLDLTLAESLLLLALKDDSGERRGTFLEYALVGAGLTELLLAGRIAEAGDPPKNLQLINSQPVGDPFTDACLVRFAERGSGKNAKTYIQSLGGKSGLLTPLYERLIERGILDEQTSKVLWVFEHTTWPEADGRPERELKARLLKTITGSGHVDVRDAAIIALAQGADVLKYNFDRDVLKRHEDRIKKIAKGDLLPPNAAIATIRAMQSAVIIAAIMPAIFVAAT